MELNLHNYLLGESMSTIDPDFKRPDHTDFMTSYELKKIGFSGIRNNELSGKIEIWVEGEMREDTEHVQFEQTFRRVFKLD